MKLTKINCKVRCDIGMCRNTADYTVETYGAIAKHRLNMCEGCMKALYKAIGEQLVPKSPANMLAKGEKNHG